MMRKKVSINSLEKSAKQTATRKFLNRMARCTTCIFHQIIRPNSRELGKNEHLHPKTGTARTIRGHRVQTEIVSSTVRPKIVCQLRCRSKESNETENRQEEIPRCHGFAPVPAFSRPEILLAQGNQCTVGQTCRDGDHGMLLHPMKDWHYIVVLLKTA